MKKEIRTIVYDETLKIEAYILEGIVQPFPNHFHEYYVIGLMKSGERCLSCKNRDYILKRNDMIIFNPRDNHSCAPKGGSLLDYHAFNISQNIMQNLAKEITGSTQLPGFSQNVICSEEAMQYFISLHDMVMNGSNEFSKEEYLLLLLSILIQEYSQPFETTIPDCRKEIEEVCAFIEEHYTESIYLEQLCSLASLSKSTLLRSFTKSKGITPYRYLETIRINEAKELLEKGASPIEAAMQTGFSDQSHFTNYFNSFIGLTPGVYRDIFLAKQKTGGNKLE